MQEALEDPSRGVVADLDVPSDVLLVAFGGIKGELSIPPFEFFRIASALPVKRVFIRDTHQAWYQKGIPGLGENVAETAEAMRQLIRSAEVRRVVMTGTSAGGYGALVFGALAGADEVHAFSPQSFLGRGRRWLARDHRYRTPLSAMLRRPPDLRAKLGGWAGPGHIHYSSNHRLDVLHAERLRRLPGITLHPYDVHGHAVVRALRDDGRLAEILGAALAGP